MDSTSRFTDRASDYAKYRPAYPEAVFELLQNKCGIGHGKVVADVGSGTGIFSKQLRGTQARVIGVEPNAAMRDYIDPALLDDPEYESVTGSAEDLPLDDNSVDLITAAQAFHWFDMSRTRAEFQRVLREPGWVALVWNTRIPDASPFQSGYEELMRDFGLDYGQSRHDEEAVGRIAQFFEVRGYDKSVFTNPQFLFWEELKGRAQSASYFPKPGHPRHEDAVNALRELFDRCKSGGRVDLEYTTEVFLGRLLP